MPVRARQRRLSRVRTSRSRIETVTFCREGISMDPVHDDRFIVFIRTPGCAGERPDAAEQAWITCASYAEARRVRREMQNASRDCIIRYIGPAGGGD